MVVNSRQFFAVVWRPLLGSAVCRRFPAIVASNEFLVAGSCMSIQLSADAMGQARSFGRRRADRRGTRGARRRDRAVRGRLAHARVAPRVKGELFLLQSSAAVRETAEDLFRQALDAARRDKALSWELRAAMSLARLLILRAGQPTGWQFSSQSTNGSPRGSTPRILIGERTSCNPRSNQLADNPGRSRRTASCQRSQTYAIGDRSWMI